MIKWKQRLYAFLLRRVLGPFLDASSNQQLHDSIDVSIQEGTYVLKDVCLNAEYLSSRTASSGLAIRKATIQRLEIQLTLRENAAADPSASSSASSDPRMRRNGAAPLGGPIPQSSLAWRAMKLGSVAGSLPAVSLVAEVRVHGVELELEPCDAPRPTPTAAQAPAADSDRPDEGTSTKNMIGSYVDAALSSLQLSLKLTSIHLKVCRRNPPRNNILETGGHPSEVAASETWVGLHLSSMTYKDLALNSTNSSSMFQTVVNKSLEISEITVRVSEGPVPTGETTTTTGTNSSQPRPSTVAMAQGSGRIYFRVMEHLSSTATRTTAAGKTPSKHKNIQQDIEVALNHQLNFSVDQSSLSQIKWVVEGLGGGGETSRGAEDDDDNFDMNQFQTPHMSAQPPSALLPNRFSAANATDDEIDKEDLKAITGIMKQYREAYHLAESNQLRGGILVPSHAYIDDLEALEEDDAMTFDVFFDANDQSFYNAASVLKESVMMRDDDELGDGDTVQTKVRMNLLSGCLKINFRDSTLDTSTTPQYQYNPQEYILISLDDLNVSLSSTRRKSELTLSIAHFEIEDAQLDMCRGGGSDIGSLLGFVSDSSDASEYANEVVVSQAPCISLNLKQLKEAKNRRTMDCDLTLLPIEMAIRQRSLSNLARFASHIGQEGETPDSTRIATTSSSNESETIMTSFVCNCPSLTASIPIVETVHTSPLFNRCGETLKNAPVRSPYLGITLDTILVDFRKGTAEETTAGLESSAKFTCLHMLVFAAAPIGEKVAVDAKMQRTDLMLLNGRTEVNPYIPISFEYRKKLISSTKASNMGREAFPLVPAISSFKARQEDEDEELKIDRMLFSKLHDVETDSRKNLRGADPQIAMVSDAEKSSSVAVLTLPDIIVDFTKTELETVVRMLEAAKPTPSTTSSSSTVVTSNDDEKEMEPSGLQNSSYFSIAINVDQVTMSLKQDFRIEDLYGDRSKRDRFSCLFALDKFRMHVLLDGSDLKHARFLTHDLALYSAFHPRIDAEVQRAERDITQRVSMMKQRISVYTNAVLSPVLYRSQIFTPICQDAPSFLIDIRDLTNSNFQMPASLSQKQIHLTLYHLTFRYDADPDWIEKLFDLLPNIDSKDKEPIPNGQEKTADESRSLTRVFMSVSDCNIDYTSPAYFETASRSIIRIGDFRFSSNIMQPAARVQAYSITLGDLSYHVCNHRLTYSSEDFKLCRARIIMQDNSIRSSRSKSTIHGTTAEALLREMSFIEVLGLDSMDAIIISTNWDSPGRKREPTTDPGMAISLTFGLLSISACKDSFDCFASSVGELQAKLTALTDEEILKLQKESDSMRKRHSTPTSTPKPQHQTKQPSGKQATPSTSDFFLLDGYDWTEIDHDPLQELKIPDGDEQVAGWYNAGKSPPNPTRVAPATDYFHTLPGKIIHHHFPLHVVSNPLSDGDMNASKYAGEGSELLLKSRLIVHKLTVKLRFYDGYDWPEKLPQSQKKMLKKNGIFVIEADPNAKESAKVTEEPDDSLFDNIESEVGHLQRKTQLMADLLGGDVDTEHKSPFEKTPLPEDKAVRLESESEIRRLSRKSKLYLQISANGVTVRVDSYDTSHTHRLASVLGLSITDMFIAESASLSYPVKMLGEWINENEHPRDSRFGTLMMKMVTWKPLKFVTADKEVESDDCEVTMQLLPMRAIIDQRAIHFASAFFRNDDNKVKETTWSSDLHLIPPPRFRAFRVKPWKLKVDYIPQKMDVGALREGSFVELINISPIDGMVITLSQVSVEGVVGFGDVIGGLTSSWLEEIVSTQLHKFLANARPFEPLTDVGQGVSDLVVLPYEAFKNGDDIQKAMSSGIKSLAETLTFQALTTSSRLTEYAARKMATVVGGRHTNSAANPIPSRPTAAPKGVQDVTGHAMESLARGLQAANYKVVIIPYREYNRHGATGAATSILRGIPVMLVAPVTGATEALSYTLLGARNALRPDIRKEEEASRTGFVSYDV